jgi:hypothetical protein
VNLGNLYRNKLGRLDDAIAAYRRAVADAEGCRHLGSPVPYLCLGSALRQKGREDEGAPLPRARRAVPGDPPRGPRELGSSP